MNRSAKITSTDAVQTLSAALHRFQYDASNALGDVWQQVTRALEWIQHDRKDYWAGEVRRGSERVAEAKLNLQRALTYRKVGDYRPACREEKQILEKAKRRLDVAREKVEMVRRWSRELEQAVFKYKGGVGLLIRWLEADLPQALAALERISSTLEAYTAVHVSPGAAALADGSPVPPAQREDASAEASAGQEARTPERPSERHTPEDAEADTAQEAGP